MKRCILLTTHVWRSARKAGFHWIAKSLWRRGWEVLFLTDTLSRIDRLRGDYRFRCVRPQELGRVIQEERGVYSFVPYSLLRPMSLRHVVLDSMTYPFFKQYGTAGLNQEVESFARKADLFIFESSLGLMRFDFLRSLNHRARYVYRVSDDLKLVPIHPVVLDTERRIAPQFDLISSPCLSIHSKFLGLANARLQYHGIAKDVFDEEYENPYGAYRAPNFVFVGNCALDCDFVDRAARLFPDCTFHVIGPFSRLPHVENVVAHGELPFQETIPFLKHADVAINARTMASLTDSLKVRQYTYCRLPIVASMENCGSHSHVFGYKTGSDESITAAINAALMCDRSSISTRGIRSWDELAAELVGHEENAHAPLPS